MKKKRFAKILSLFLMSVLLVTGCSSGGTTSSGGGDAAAGKTTFIVGIDADIPTCDPIQCNAFTAELVVDSMYDTLLKFSQDGSQLEPCLAKSWEMKDKKTYVYQLRDDVKFWDGTPMTAEDVVYSMNRHLNPDLASLFGYLLASVKSIEKTGDYEVTVKLSEPDVSFQYAFATMAGAVVKKDFVEENGEQFGKSSVGTMATGPYKFKSWTEGNQIVLEKNADYWDKEANLMFETVEFNVIEDEASRAMALTSGQIDFMNTPTNDVMEQLKSSENVKVCYKEGLQNTYIAFNCSRAPFDDVNARKAAAYAIDAAAIAKAVNGEGMYSDAGALDFDPNVMKYDTENWVNLQSQLDAYTYNVEKAKEYLAKSKYRDGFECTMPTCAIVQKTSESVQYYLKEVNIKVNLETVPISDFYSAIYGSVRDENDKRDYDLISFIWFPDYPDPISFLKTLYYSTGEVVGGSNMMGYQNEEFDKLMDAQASQTDPAERSATMQEACKLLNSECATKQIAYGGPVYAINSAYEFDMSPMWLWNFNITQITKAK